MRDYRSCEYCPRFEEEQKKILQKADSVFDAAYDMQSFVQFCEDNFECLMPPTR